MNKKPFTSCPKCQAEVSRIKYGDVEVEFCPNCKGFFLDATELSHPNAASFDDSSQAAHLDTDNLDKLMIECPKCGVVMQKHKPKKKQGQFWMFVPPAKVHGLIKGSSNTIIKTGKELKEKNSTFHSDLYALIVS